MGSTVKSSLFLLFALGIGMTNPGMAWAAEGDKAAAESLFQAGRELMEQQRYAEACPKFAEAQRLDPTLGTMLNLARCHEAEGKVATAWAEYREVAVLAKKEGQDERATVAADLAAKLEPTVPKLRIGVPAHGPAGLEIKRDGVIVGAGALGAAVALDPGEHTVEASAPGFEPWSTKINIAASSGENTVTVPPMVAVIAAKTSTPPQRVENGSNSRRTAGFVTLGIGVAAAGVGAVLGGLTLADANRARDDSTLCPNNVCTPAGRDVINGAESKALGSTIFLIAGGVAAATGLVIVLASPRTEPAQPNTSLQIVPSIGGLVLQGRY